MEMRDEDDRSNEELNRKQNCGINGRTDDEVSCLSIQDQTNHSSSE